MNKSENKLYRNDRSDYSSVLEKEIFFGSGLLGVMLKSGFPKRFKLKPKNPKLVYTKNISDANIHIEYSFLHNKLQSINYSYEPVGFTTTRNFFETCRNLIKENLLDESVCFEKENEISWETSDGFACEHILLSNSNNRMKLSIKHFV